jgi:hypothetical protein
VTAKIAEVMQKPGNSLEVPSGVREQDGKKDRISIGLDYCYRMDHLGRIVPYLY